MLHERVEIPIRIQERNTLVNTETGNQGIDGAADRNALPTQQPVSIGGTDGAFHVHKLDRPGKCEKSTGQGVIRIDTESLQYLNNHQITNQYIIPTQKPIQQIGFFGIPAAQVIDPDT